MANILFWSWHYIQWDVSHVSSIQKLYPVRCVSRLLHTKIISSEMCLTSPPYKNYIQGEVPHVSSIQKSYPVRSVTRLLHTKIISSEKCLTSPPYKNYIQWDVLMMGFPTKRCIIHAACSKMLQWNLSVTTTSLIKFVTCDLFNNAF